MSAGSPTAPQTAEGHEWTVKLEWAVVGLAIWLISLGTCFVCEPEPEFRVHRLLPAREREGHNGETDDGLKRGRKSWSTATRAT